MRKKNCYTYIFFLILIVITNLNIDGSKKIKAKNQEIAEETRENINMYVPYVKVETKKKDMPKITPTLEDTLFIGDSRTVGVAEYANLNEADFFAAEGMSVYDVLKKQISVKTVGKVTLKELLDAKKYDKVFIMLGINEIGYEKRKTQEKYQELVEFIRNKNPKTIVFIQSNLHVTKNRSKADNIINNAEINKLNSMLCELADGAYVHYADVNTLFDDKEGNLEKDKSGDGVHLYAKYYVELGNWIREYIKEISGRNYGS